MRPISTPHPDLPAVEDDEGKPPMKGVRRQDTGVFPVTRRTARRWIGAVATILAGSGFGGGAWLHSKRAETVDQAVRERTAALEARHDELRGEVHELSKKVDKLSNHQVDAEEAAKQRQAELLEAIKGKRR